MTIGLPSRGSLVRVQSGAPINSTSYTVSVTSEFKSIFLDSRYTKAYPCVAPLSTDDQTSGPGRIAAPDFALREAFLVSKPDPARSTDASNSDCGRSLRVISRRRHARWFQPHLQLAGRA